MRRALQVVFVLAAIGAICSAAERKSWNRVRYVGGTIAIRASPYDWNTTVTVTANPGTITLVIAPASVFGHGQTVRFQASQIAAVLSGPGAWQRVAEVAGAEMPSKPPTLFGMLQRHAFLGILYRGDDGKPAAVLLDTFLSFQISRYIEALTGKPTEYVK
jgi:hypothetical protein